MDPIQGSAAGGGIILSDCVHMNLKPTTESDFSNLGISSLETKPSILSKKEELRSEVQDLLPREKLERDGPERLKDYELLAILLRTGLPKKNVLQVSKEILRTYPPEALLNLKMEPLKKIRGIGLSKASTLVAAFELAKRAFHKGLGTSYTILRSKDILPLITSIRSSRKEHFIAIFLNSRKQVIHQETISIGVLDGSLVHPREVFQPAIQISAASVIFAHNHPSGDVSPSREDILITQRLCQAGLLLGIDVLDHVIISKDAFLSLREDDPSNSIGFSREGF
ncbi:MAG: DNA repair protein RadC [Chlamydiae bacterium]|nr:DNA repair protein RadC [Chlamydiota bacterium]MBI3276525.1 DNA repair protein RadC [Chlamydiota bacterium]